MLERKEVQAGTKLSPNVTCKYPSLLTHEIVYSFHRRTYPDENQGEDIREGYEPTDSDAVIDPKSSAEVPEFAVGEEEEDDEDEGNTSSPDDSEESKHWREAREPEHLLVPKYGTSDEVLGNVWAGDEPAEPPRENP